MHCRLVHLRISLDMAMNSLDTAIIGLYMALNSLDEVWINTIWFAYGLTHPNHANQCKPNMEVWIYLPPYVIANGMVEPFYFTLALIH